MKGSSESKQNSSVTDAEKTLSDFVDGQRQHQIKPVELITPNKLDEEINDIENKKFVYSSK